MYLNVSNITNLSLTAEERKHYAEKGYLGPYTLFEGDHINHVLKRCYSNLSNLMLPTTLARHNYIKEMAALAMHSGFVQKLVTLLGEDILLWGSQIIKQKPFHKHRFHCDAEFSAIEGISIWLGVKNVISEESFSVISGSHLFSTSPQELSEKEGLDLYDAKAVEAAAKKFNPESRLLKLKITDGQFILLHGKLWHGTHNPSKMPRYAINLRYTIPSAKVRISKNGRLPDTTWSKQQPLCLLVSGQDSLGINKLTTINKISKTKIWIKGLLFYLPRNVILKLVSRIKL